MQTCLYTMKTNLLGNLFLCFPKSTSSFIFPALLCRISINLGFTSLIFTFLLSIVHDDEHQCPEAPHSIENMFPALQEVDMWFYSGANCPRSLAFSLYHYKITSQGTPVHRYFHRGSIDTVYKTFPLQPRAANVNRLNLCRLNFAATRKASEQHTI